ncbi:hypothetical protein Plhal304r1_c029g0096721 [Plasmopara halstedii]
MPSTVARRTTDPFLATLIVRPSGNTQMYSTEHSIMFVSSAGSLARCRLAPLSRTQLLAILPRHRFRQQVRTLLTCSCRFQWNGPGSSSSGVQSSSSCGIATFPFVFRTPHLRHLFQHASLLGPYQTLSGPTHQTRLLCLSGFGCVMLHLAIKACLESWSAYLTMFLITNVGDAFVAIMKAFRYR